ncbi:MAG TPA: PAC2 family protein [Candidatus Norongarragalinales archaeon]|jgi:hypothetical protein|nr:PAC2 family protein [Candidatus Norongarragalinales archaeon]
MDNNKSTPTFKESFVHTHKDTKPKSPVLVMGLPGIGLVSKLAVDHTVKVLNAKKIASLYSPAFFNQTLALKNGKLKPFTLKFYHVPNAKHDLVILRGELQPLTVEGQYEVTSKVLEYFTKTLEGKLVFAMAGYAVQKKIEKPILYGASTHNVLFQKLAKHGVKPPEQHVPIVGMAGLVPGLAPLYGAAGATLLVETPGNQVDAKGAQRLIDFLSSFTGHKIDTKELEKRAKKMEEMLKKAESPQAPEAPRAATPKTEEILKRETLSYIR